MSKRYLCDFELNASSEQFDVVIVGAGASGLFAALNMPDHLKVLVIAKEGLEDCNSQLAQGGIAITLDEDYASHIEDTLEAGSYYNRPMVVEAFIKGSKPAFDKLSVCDIEFDKDHQGQLLFTGEGGHTKRRIIHNKDISGEAVMKGLIQKVRQMNHITIRTNTTAVDLVTDEYGVIGIVLFGNHIETIKTSTVVMATGGIGGLFENTTNASTVTGDGLAMALRAGVELSDTEFIQFHPTAMAMRSGGYFLISEAVRGEGGYLVNDLGERFMIGKHKMNELAPRDVVSKAINEEIQNGRSVYVDVRHMEKGYFENRFPKIYSKCLENGLDPTQSLIPISPVEHYYMGGIACNLNGETNLKGLFVTGEASCSGFHGANRLASNSLLECLVLSLFVSEYINKHWEQLKRTEYQLMGRVSSVAHPLGSEDRLQDEIQWEDIKHLVSQNLTIVRHRDQLVKTMEKIELLLEQDSMGSCSTLEQMKVYNGLQVLQTICEASVKREESLGSFLIVPK